MKEFPTYFTSEHALSMTMRDYFAAKAMQGDISTAKNDLDFGADHWSVENIAKRSYAMADAMMEARK